MKFASLRAFFWDSRSRPTYLLFASFILIFTMLGAREIWTQEHRWADIVFGMFYRHDFLHPYLIENTYYDKPLLSYWLIAFFAKISGKLTPIVLRLPSALAGVLAIWSIYLLGTVLKNRQLGLLAGWLLLTTFYFVFWARTSSADMLNLAGSLFAVAWYFDKKERPNLINYTIFFVILSLTALCKGLVGAVVPCLLIMLDIFLTSSWKKHFNGSLVVGLLPAILIYVAPFMASAYYGGDSYHQNGLYLVYRENILRYFQPFDHEGPLYTYFIYLPIYLIPWSLFLLPAIFYATTRWKTLSTSSKWMALSVLILFLFFTCSGSRRSYYILPVVPFAVLFIADWILSVTYSRKNQMISAGLIVGSYLGLFVYLDILQPWYYSVYGINNFASTLKEEAQKRRPWAQWNIVMLDGESKLRFYLQLPPTVKNYPIDGKDRNLQTSASLLHEWNVLAKKPKKTIFITREAYVQALQPFFPGYYILHSNGFKSNVLYSLGIKSQFNMPVAFIPT